MVLGTGNKPLLVRKFGFRLKDLSELIRFKDNLSEDNYENVQDLRDIFHLMKQSLLKAN